MRATSYNIGQLLYQRGDGKETAKKFSPMIDLATIPVPPIIHCMTSSKPEIKTCWMN